MLQDGLDLSGVHRPHHGGGIGGAGGQVLTAGAEAAAVHPVAVSGQRGEGQLAEVSCGVNADALIGGAGGQQSAGERAAVHIVSMTLQGADQRHHVCVCLAV